MRWGWLFIFIFYSLLLQATNVSSILKEIPDQDREEIGLLFSNLVKQDHFAYTLFGDKPVSISGHFTLTPWENTVEQIPSDAIFWKRWQIWEKYKNLFRLNNYIILNEKYQLENHNLSHIILINKREFLSTICRYQPLFEAVLGNQIIPEQLLSSIESGKSALRDCIKNNHMLWGILLGYGKHNAILYNKREHDGLYSIALATPQLEHSTIKLSSCADRGFYPYLIGPVHFVGDLDHPETIALRKKYQKLRGEISAIYAKGDFLEITLSKLAE